MSMSLGKSARMLVDPVTGADAMARVAAFPSVDPGHRHGDQGCLKGPWGRSCLGPGPSLIERLCRLTGHTEPAGFTCVRQRGRTYPGSPVNQVGDPAHHW